MDWIVTGASRGIGRALALALRGSAKPGDRLFALARDAEKLRELGEWVVPIPVDLSRVKEARLAGERLAVEVKPGAVLVHNAGLWPSKLELVDGQECAFATNCLGPLALQAPLLEKELLSRVLVVSAGLLVQGRFSEEKTPKGEDFSTFRTYSTTKLAQAITMRDAAKRHPKVDFAIVHPGVVNTELGSRSGLLGRLLRAAKRAFLETPESCAARLVRLLNRPQWEHTPGIAPWFHEEQERPWPAAVDRDERAVLSAVQRLQNR